MAWYRFGSVNLTNGSAVVTGVSTLWANQVKPGDMWTQDSTRWYEIKSVDSDTQITLTEAYAGATANGVAYAIVVAFNATTNADLSSRISKLIQNYQTNTDQMIDWLGGAVGGGTNHDGKYPITDFYGNTTYVKSPAQLQADYNAIQTNVAITGGTMNGVVIGGTNPAAITGTSGVFSDLTVNGTILGTHAGASKNGNFNAQSAGTASYAWTVTDGAANSKNWDLIANGTTLYGRVLSDDIATTVNNWLVVTRSGATITNVALPERLLVNGATDDGSTALQVGGSGKITGNFFVSSQIQMSGGGWTAPANGYGISYGSAAYGLVLAGNGTTYDVLVANKGGSFVIAIPTNTTRVLVSGPADDGSTALQVAGAAKATGDIFNDDGANGRLVLRNSASYNSLLSMTTGAGAYKNLQLYAQRFLLNTSTDNGTDTLQVAGSAVVSGILKARDPSHTLSTTGFSTYVSLTDSANSVAANIGYTSPSNFDFSIYHGLNGNLLLYTNAAERMRIAATGQVLIGTTANNGADTLQVNGTIYSAGNIAISTTGPAGGLVLKGAGIMYNSDVWGPVAVYQGGTFVGRSYWVGQTNGSPGFVVDTRFTPNALLLIDKGSANTAALLINGAINNGADTLQVNGSAAVYGTVNGYNFIPMSDNAYNIGSASYRMANVYSVNGVVTTSDARYKTFTGPSLGLDFINRLETHTGYWSEKGEADGLHQWLSAQQVEAALIKMGVKNFAGLSKPKDAPMGLQYSEFIAPLIRGEQELNRKLDAALERIAQLEAQLH